MRGELTINQLSTKYAVHATQINRCKSQVLKSLKSSFNQDQVKAVTDQQTLIDELYKRIGELSCGLCE